MPLFTALTPCAESAILYHAHLSYSCLPTIRFPRYIPWFQGGGYKKCEHRIPHLLREHLKYRKYIGMPSALYLQPCDQLQKFAPVWPGRKRSINLCLLQNCGMHNPGLYYSDCSDSFLMFEGQDEFLTRWPLCISCPARLEGLKIHGEPDGFFQVR